MTEKTPRKTTVPEQSMEGKTSWTTGDVIDLEYFIYQDRDTDEKESRNRDRTLFVRHIQPVLKRRPPSRDAVASTVMRLWLQHRREENQGTDPDVLFPGDAFNDGYRIMGIIMILAGLFIGFGSTGALLRYTGIQPINVSIYLACLLFPQVLLLLVLIMSLGLTTVFRQKSPPSPIYGAIGAVLVNVIKKFSGLMRKTVSPDRQRGTMSAIGLIRGRQRLRKNLFLLPVFILAQWFGVCFNAGVLSATLIRLTGTDLAFGWQSTLQLSPGFVHRMVGVIAAPWERLVPPDWAYPSLSQIQGSRMILKEGILQLTTPDLTAWWPFLCLCILVYGLVPRIFLLTLAILLRKRALLKMDFNDAQSHAVLTRMMTPAISMGHGPSKQTEIFSHSNPLSVEKNDSDKADFLKYDARCIALIPEDIFDHCRAEQLLQYFPNRFSFKGIKTVKVTLDENDDDKPIKGFFKQNGKEALPNAFLLLEAWRPPIKEILDYIKWLRKVLGNHLLIYIGLIGKPMGDEIFTPPSDPDWQVWKQKTAMLRDPYLRCERAAPHDG